METYIQEDLIRTKEELIDFCTSFLFHNLVRGDAIFIQEAYAAAKERDVDRLLDLEQLCGAMKLAKESREASVNLGRQFIRTVSPLGTDDFLAEWKERIDAQIRSKGITLFCTAFIVRQRVLAFIMRS